MEAAVSYADFASLRELQFRLSEDERAQAEELAAIPLLTTLTSLALLSGAVNGAALEGLQRLPHLKKLVLRSVKIADASLSEKALALAAATLECMERCTFTFRYDTDPGWLVKLSSLRRLHLELWAVDLRTLAGLPALRSLRLDVHELKASPPHATDAFPCLGDLTVVFGDDMTSFPSLLLPVETPDVITPMGRLASMSRLTSLEVGMHPGTSARHALHSSELEVLRDLKSVTIDLKAFQRPVALSALAHVKSVAIISPMEEAEVSCINMFARMEALCCEPPDAVAFTGHLSSITTLKSLKLIKQPLPSPSLLTPIRRARQWQPSAGVALPQLRTLHLDRLEKMDHRWGQILPNVVSLVLEGGNIPALPAVKKGSWPRLMCLKLVNVPVTSVSHTWFTLPSLRRLVLTECHDLKRLPDIPKGNHAPLRELELRRCSQLKSLPQTFVHLEQLSAIKHKWCPNLDVPPSLASLYGGKDKMSGRECGKGNFWWLPNPSFQEDGASL